jgi:NADH:ubiquinone oxidoreductase subunit 5 (subunit L)/multisubunit Na+/H+ antiporter MnhA subunit
MWVGKMKALAREILRWCVVAASGGYGAWQVVDVVWRVATRWKGGWFDALFVLLVPLLFAAPFLAVAYYCLRRQYRKLLLVLGAVGAVVLFGLLSMLPRQLGLFERMDACVRQNHAFAFFGLPLMLVVLLGPIYAAAWFFRLCQRLAYCRTRSPEERATPKTRPTHWLLCLGIVLLMSPMIGMMFAFRAVVQSSTQAQAMAFESSIENWLVWAMAGTTVGPFLLFLGLVRRRPIPDRAECHGQLNPSVRQCAE